MPSEQTYFPLYEKEIKNFKKVSATELMSLVEDYQSAKGPKALQSIFEATCKLGSKIAFQFTYSGLPLEDLIGVANEAIMMASLKWTKDWPNIQQFFAYEIYNRLRHFCWNETGAVRFPESFQRKFKSEMMKMDMATKKEEPFIPFTCYHQMHNWGISVIEDSEIPYEDEEQMLVNFSKEIIDAVEQLPELQKEIIRLIIDEGLSPDASADRLQISLRKYANNRAGAIRNIKTVLSGKELKKQAVNIKTVKQPKVLKNKPDNALRKMKRLAWKYMKKDGIAKKVFFADFENYRLNG